MHGWSLWMDGSSMTDLYNGKTRHLRNRFCPSFPVKLLSQMSSIVRPVWQDWAILKDLDSKFSYKRSPNIVELVGLVWKMAVLSKNWCDYYLGNFLENWATLCFSLWSHCVRSKFSKSQKKFWRKSYLELITENFGRLKLHKRAKFFNLSDQNKLKRLCKQKCIKAF